LRILFITTHNLATNPRLVKEIELALQQGFKVELICFEFDNWSRELNEQLKRKFEAIKMHIIPAGRKPWLPWLQSVIAESGGRFAGKIFPLPLSALSQAVSRRSSMIIKILKNIDGADWVIGHSPGALYATLVAANKFNCKAGFDVEDYHPGEVNDAYLQNLSRQLMQQVLPQMNYVSFAAPLIKEAVEKDCGRTSRDWFTVLNYFPAGEFSKPVAENEGKIKMVWFSQNINAGRGLELVLSLVKEAGDKMELHLFGNLNNDFYNTYLKDISNIVIHQPVVQQELHRSLAQFDIGLALEPAKDKNNELAVSNKILAYLQAGLFVVATNTAAQEKLLKEFPEHSFCFDYKGGGAKNMFEKIIAETGPIRSRRSNRHEAFENRNWEKESLELLKRWDG